MSDSDPLLRAVAGEDPACPDGRMLVALGRLIRRHSVPPRSEADLADDVVARLNDTDGIDSALIDAAYDHIDAAVDPTLARLGELVRTVGPRPVELTARVLHRIRASSRFAAFTKDDGSRLDRTSRWRIWSAVAAGHFAALLAFAIFEIGFSGHHDGAAPPDQAAVGQGGSGIGLSTMGIRNGEPLPGVPALPPHLPATWPDIRGLGSDLFLLRRFPELRQEARHLYGMEGSSTAVGAGLAWLQAQQDPVSGCFGTLGGNEERDLSTQSLAILALLGEGLGDKARSAAARRGLGWLCGRLATSADGGPTMIAATSQATAGLVALALVEGGLMLGDESLQMQAEQTLADLDRSLPMHPGAAGLGGFLLLALETAQQGGLHVPGRLLQQARRNIGQVLPAAQEDDAGRLGVAAFTRFILGHSDNPSTTRQVERLGELLPASDAAGRADPLGWFFATLALREAGGKSWEKWSEALQSNLAPLLAHIENGQAHVDAAKVRYGDSGGTVFATSVVLLDLQVPYRYLPVATPP